MPFLLCRNRVESFDQWLRVFESHREAQIKSGLRLLHLWQEAGDTQNVFFLFETEDHARARDFVSDPNAADAGAAAGVIDGDFPFLDELQST